MEEEEMLLPSTLERPYDLVATTLIKQAEKEDLLWVEMM